MSREKPNEASKSHTDQKPSEMNSKCACERKEAPTKREKKNQNWNEINERDKSVQAKHTEGRKK